MEDKDIIALGDELFMHPQLGYKEFENKAILTDFLQKEGFKIENECFETAFSVSFGEGHPHIGLIAELDAIPVLGHPFANKEDNAAHACGHSTQCAIMAAAMVRLKEMNLPGKVTLFFTPGEEFTDMPYRKKLIEEGKISYIGGKSNMLAKGLFDDVDLFIHCHASSDQSVHFALNTALAGFVYKKLTFKGKAAHAAVLPHLGRNALSAFTLFQTAIGLMRESFDDNDHVRIHGIVNEGGQTVNSIPERVTYECYVRCLKTDRLTEISKRVDEAAIHSALALGCECEIENTPGYLPMKQEKKISDVVEEIMYEYCNGPEDIDNNSWSVAAGDVGDISVFKPIIQFGYTGFSGVIHGKDLEISNKERVYLETSEIVVKAVKKLLTDPAKVKDIADNYQQLMSKEEYLAYLSGK